VLRLLPTTVAVFLLAAPAALAHDQGQGWYGETTDKVVTNAGFILIIFFPTFILLASLLQWKLEKRKDARKKAAKARSASTRWQGGW
jgi:ABC-type nickel/cobalt efflux system permease component RcnA